MTVYVHTYVCMYVYIHINRMYSLYVCMSRIHIKFLDMYTYVHTFLHVCVCVYKNTVRILSPFRLPNVCVCVRMYVCMHTTLYMSMFMCTSAYVFGAYHQRGGGMFVCVCTHTYVRTCLSVHV